MKHFGLISVAALGLLCILTLAGCRQGAHYRADLLRADSVMDARPDSAYGIVARLRPDSLDDANRALLCLLTTQAKWKTDQDISNDTAWDAAIRHFTEQEDYDRLAKCYYYKGVVCKERNEVDRAMTNYLSAAENIEKTRDYYYINLINSYIGHLYTDQMAYDKTYKYFTRAYRAAKAMNDSTGMAYALMDLSGYYDCRRQFQKNVTNAYEAFILIHCDTTNAYYVTIANCLANSYWFLKDYKKSLHYALQILPIYSKDTVSDNGPHYASLAEAYFGTKKYDEAEKYYLLSAKSPVLATRLVSYDGLRDICDVRGESRQAARYQAIADSLRQVIYDQNKAEQLIESKDAYSLQKTEIAGRKAELRNRLIVAVCIVIAVGLAVSFFLFMRRRKAHDMKRLRDLYSKMQADWQAEKSREMEQLQQEMEALRTKIGQPQEDTEKMEELQQRLSQLEADNGKQAEMMARQKDLRSEIFSGRHDNALACLRKVNTHPKADMITKLDWAQLYLLIDAIDPTFRPTYEPRTTGLMQNYRMHCLRFLGVPINHIAIVFNGISSESVSKGIYRSKLRGRQ